jgi:DNA-binding MarR family transcriptional regulator
MAGPNPTLQLVAEIDREFRKFRVHLGFFEQAVAERLGLNRTDLLVLMLLYDAETMTAGEIAQATSLTTGAVTAVIDRLERNGFAGRERNPADRRCVVVRLAPQRRRQIAEIFQPLLRRIAEVYSRRTDKELSTLLRFLETATPVLHRETAKLRPDAPAREPINDGPQSFAAPVGSARRGRLLLRPAAAQVRVWAEPLTRDLYRARFEGPPPSVRATPGLVSIAYSRQRAAAKKRHLAEVALNTSIPWEIEARGGTSKFRADLSGVLLQSLTVADGAWDVAVTLPSPIGTVRITLTGGVGKLKLLRPAGVAARLNLEGASSKVAFDAQRFGTVGGDTRLESPSYEKAQNRYEITVLGGATAVVVNELARLALADPQPSIEAAPIDEEAPQFEALDAS